MNLRFPSPPGLGNSGGYHLREERAGPPGPVLGRKQPMWSRASALVRAMAGVNYTRPPLGPNASEEKLLRSPLGTSQKPRGGCPHSGLRGPSVHHSYCTFCNSGPAAFRPRDCELIGVQPRPVSGRTCREPGPGKDPGPVRPEHRGASLPGLCGGQEGWRRVSRGATGNRRARSGDGPGLLLTGVDAPDDYFKRRGTA